MPLYTRQLFSDCKLNCVDIALGKARKSLRTLVHERRLAGAFAENFLKWDTVENVLLPVNTSSVHVCDHRAYNIYNNTAMKAYRVHRTASLI